MKQLQPNGYGFSVTFDGPEPLIGLAITTESGKGYMVPMTAETAETIAGILADHVTCLRMAQKRASHV